MAENVVNNRFKPAFGSSENVSQALEQGLIDKYDLLLLDGNTDVPKVGWVDAEGVARIVDTEKVIVVEDEFLPTSGEVGKIYIFGEDGYFWNGEKFINLCKPTDVSDLKSDVDNLETDVSELQVEIATKIDAKEVDAKIDAALDMIDEIEYEISHNPEGTLVDYRDKEIRIMCPKDTEWKFQQSGEGADKNKYYIGFKAYAPSDDVVGFKEDIGKIISDNTMYDFNGDFSGIDENGRKYSIVWFPVATYDEEKGTWEYSGEKSSVEKFIGWYYSVEWYNTNGIVKSDCIRINLANEDCYSSIESFYASELKNEAVTVAVTNANKYTDDQIAAFEKMFTIIEF